MPDFVSPYKRIYNADLHSVYQKFCDLSTKKLQNLIRHFIKMWKAFFGQKNQLKNLLLKTGNFYVILEL